MHHTILNIDYKNLEHAAKLLTQDDCVVLPTETVYGLAANALSSLAVANIYAIKNRPTFNPLIVHVKNLDDAQIFAEFNADAVKLAQAFWPGPLTLVVPIKPCTKISPLVTAGLNTVAIRCPAHPVFQSILSMIDFPLAAPSANPSQYLSPTSAIDVNCGFSELQQSLTIIDGGICDQGLESTIVDTTTQPFTILRAGTITHHQLDYYVMTQNNTHHIQPIILTAPGQMQRHYAPHTPIRLNTISINPGEVYLGFGPDTTQNDAFILNLSVSADLTEAAHNLFNYLHILDNQNAAGIAVAPIPNIGIGVAINDRLKRAATK